MKKLALVLLVMIISFPSFAGLKEKDVVGSWSYKVETGQETLTGLLVFELKEDKLTGKVQTGNGESFAFTKVEIRKNNILYFELQPEYEVLTGTLTINKNSYEGRVTDGQREYSISGEKKK